MKFRLLQLLVVFALASNFATAQDYDLRTSQDGLDIVVEILYTGTGAVPTTADFLLDLGFEVQSTDQTMTFGTLSNEAGYGFAYQGAQTVSESLARRTLVIQNPLNFPTDLSSTVYTEIVRVTTDAAAGSIISVGPLGTHPDQPAAFPYVNVNGLDYIPTTTAGQALPVELTVFSIDKLEKTSARLMWSTETELEFSHFEIERSVNNGVTWNKIDQVQGYGNTVTTQRYQTIDADIPLMANAETTVYYRLKMVDVNGSFEYSDLRSVTFEARDNNVSIYPNPSSSQITINADLEVTDVTIFDIQGKLVYNQVNANVINISEFESGMYKVIITTEAGAISQTLVKID